MVCLFLSLVLQDDRILVCAQLLVMIVIAGRLSLLGFVFKPVSWPAGDSRLRKTFCNMCTCSGNDTQEWAVQDLRCLVDLYFVYLI